MLPREMVATTEDRNVIANDIKFKTNASVIPSYDHKHVLLAEGLPGRYL